MIHKVILSTYHYDNVRHDEAAERDFVASCQE
jgi:hypothetical protein